MLLRGFHRVNEMKYHRRDIRIVTNRVNLLRWNDVPRTSRIFRPKIAIFSQF